MSINRLYHTWFNWIEQLRPGEHITRLRNLAWLLVGIYESKSVHLSKVALEIPGEAKTPSITRRLIRLLNNPAIRVREWYEPVHQENPHMGLAAREASVALTRLPPARPRLPPASPA